MGVLLFLACAMLAAEPLVWLVRTWTDPAYDSFGGFAAALVAVLFLASATSPRGRDASPRERTRAARLLLLTAAVRLAGASLAINALSAVALVLDVYALGLWFGLAGRRRPVAPGWLAASFAFALPIERIIQRLFGYGLQHLSAEGACRALGMAFDGVRCEGVRILVGGTDVLVDLPCSGARGLTLLMLCFAATAAWRRPAFVKAAAGFALTLVAAWIANTIRVAVLATGVAKSELLGGVDLMSEPLHGIIGMAVLVPAVIVIAVWGKQASQNRERSTVPEFEPKWGTVERPRFSRVQVLAFVAAACIIVVLPGRPLDVAEAVGAPLLPERLAGDRAVRVPLSRQERVYYTQFGGGAAKASYGESTLLVVRTSSPLRHLHAPDECLAGAGHRVTRAGLVRGILPYAEYRSIAPDGRVWKIHVTYVADDGYVALSVAEAVWRWLSHPGGGWTAVQRIRAEEHGPDPHFEAAVARAFLDLNPMGAMGANP